MLLILIVTSYVTAFISFFIYCMPHHLFNLDMCDDTTYVTPIWIVLDNYWPILKIIKIIMPTHAAVINKPTHTRCRSIHLHNFWSSCHLGGGPCKHPTSCGRYHLVPHVWALLARTDIGTLARTCGQNWSSSTWHSHADRWQLQVCICDN